MAAKLPVDEYTLISDYCKRKGVTPSKLIRDLLLHEIELSRPANVAGRNVIEYSKQDDRFIWYAELDDSRKVEIMRVSPDYLMDLLTAIGTALEIRGSAINKRKKSSIAIPGTIVRGRK